MSKFVHKGVEITITPGGAFTAVVGGKTIMAPSLPAMRKKLDKAAEFESFSAFVHTYGGQIKRFRVTGVRNNPRKDHWNPLLFVCDDGENRSRVYPDTPENVAAHEAYETARKAHEAEWARLDNQLREIKAKLVERKPALKTETVKAPEAQS